ncbi:GAF domain-containing SpoIIE family protein phosphatase [Streptomyces sp. TRM 70361]|uniref:PP2C family protein-serine/threonine phosphatase n=1 Tax=Streptomyces sp. TRM 70361 TaxID=3116553 RepID=UPI002E7B464B|nr:GAF domain-containing SpoIIE family protein phosphatase [Streptomyces sp. TRM 70361]MEE1941373.1 GAF domain-containing SpoIIE family protein phosphatase [Streptomyces sp. TRM 70361]
MEQPGRPLKDDRDLTGPRLALNADPDSGPGPGSDPVTEQIRTLTRAQVRLRGLLEAVLAISRELEPSVVLRRVVTTAMELVDARYGALGVLDESGERLARFIPVGLDEREEAALAGVEPPRGHGLLGHLIHHPEPLRVEDIAAHPGSAGFPPGHPPMRTLLGVSIGVRGEIYGDLYLSDRRDGRPFDAEDEEIVIALAAAAGVAIENARLFERVRSGAENFQRMLLPRLPDLRPFGGAAVYRPANAPEQLGGDWYDAILLPDRSCAVVIGDVIGHDLTAAAAMAQTRNMLRALLYDRRTPPSLVLTQLDRTLEAIADSPVTTACLARVEPDGPAGAGGSAGATAWRLRWSSAGHPPPLVVTPDRRAEYLYAEPGVPLGVDPGLPRPDHTRPLPDGAVVVLFTDGLVEDPRRPLDETMAALARVAADHAALPPDELCRVLADRHTGGGHDDLAVLVLRVPERAVRPD